MNQPKKYDIEDNEDSDAMPFIVNRVLKDESTIQIAWVYEKEDAKRIVKALNLLEILDNLED